MRQSTTQITIDTRRQGLVDITAPIRRWVDAQAMQSGLLTVFCRHTSASLLIQENAAPEVRTDIEAYFERIAPESSSYLHDDEGPDDMPAHIKAMLTGSSLVVPVADGRPMLGTWQGLFLAEHRRRPHQRAVVAHVAGD